MLNLNLPATLGARGNGIENMSCVGWRGGGGGGGESKFGFFFFNVF